MLRGHIRSESERTMWAEFRDGFTVEIRYIPRTHLLALQAASRTYSVDKFGQMKEVEDNKLFHAKLAVECVRNWHGLTPAVLRTLVDMDTYPESEVPYSAEDCIELLENAYGFSRWIGEVSSTLAYFVAADQAAAKKNSQPSPVASSS